MKDSIILTITWIMELIQLFLLAKMVFFQKILYQKNKIIIIIILISVSLGIAIIFAETPFLILLIASILLFLTLLKGSKRHCFFVFWTIYWIMNDITYIISVLLSLFTKKKYYIYLEKYPEIFFQYICSIFLILIIGFAVKYRNEFIKNLPDSFYGISAFGGGFFFFFIMPAIQFGRHENSEILQNIIVIGSVFSELLFFLTLLAFFIVDRKCSHYEIEFHLTESLLQITKDYCREILENEKEVRKIRHDIKYHILTIKYFLSEKKYQELSEYLKEYDKEIEKTFQIQKITGNEILDAILTRYIQQNPNISFQIEGKLFKTDINNYDLCLIFSNAITNSIEACNCLKNKKKQLKSI